MIYASALQKSGRSEDEIRGMVREFHETFEDEEEPLTITASAIMSVEGDGWFFGDENFRVLTGRLLGQFQHRVAQYNYVDESEVLRRWADSYDAPLREAAHPRDRPVVGNGEAWILRSSNTCALSSGNTLVLPRTSPERSAP